MPDLAQQLTLYQLMVEKSLGLMCIHDLAGALLAINPAACRSLDYREEEGIGRNLKEFLAPQVQHLFDQYLQRISVRGFDSGLMRLVARDGSERIWSYHNVVYNEPGSAPRVLGHGLDVTREALAESALRENQKALTKAHDELALRVAERTAELQQANDSLRAEIDHRKAIEEELLRVRKLESLSVMAGGIAHDFNNFLTIVQGNIALAMAEAPPGHPIHQSLQQTAAACVRATSLASQLLTFAKGGAPVRRIGSLAAILSDAVSLAQAGSTVAISLKTTADLWPSEFDAEQISRAVHNILLNARQAMPQGGSIVVVAENVVADASLPLSPGNYVKISVRDQGFGIPPEILPKIFDPYFTTKSAGSGLGLATAYSIISKHGGHIAVESRTGAGTVFRIYLPASECTFDATVAVNDRVHYGSGRILVMDDELAIRKLLTATLRHLGYDVECAADGAETLAFYRQAKATGEDFTAVLVDLTIPGGMGGKETAAKLREMDPSVKLILCSGYSDDVAISEYRTYGFDDVLLKPWTVAQLSAALERVLT